MSDNNRTTPPDKTMFINLISMLATSAIQQISQKPDPEKGGVEAAMQSAQMIIDMLDMIDRKTKGNLDSDEERMLRDTLSSLKLAFVETAERNKSKAPSEKQDQLASEEKTTEETVKEQPEPENNKQEESKKPDSKEDQDKKKYHKSYG